MKEIYKTFYKCEICGFQYGTKREALGCESKGVSQDKGVKVGDIVLITSGDAGCKAKVTKRYIIDREWGHYAWERYWHTVGLTADIIGESGTRMLTFDTYDII